MGVPHTPAGYHTATPYLTVKGADAALEFYKKALGAEETVRMAGPDGSVMHAEFRVGDSVIMLGEENPMWGAKGPHALGGSPVGVMLYLPDVDARFAAAVAAGATVFKPLKDQFYGDRSGTVVDPFGHMWTLATHVEDVAPDEMERRFEAEMKKFAA